MQNPALADYSDYDAGAQQGTAIAVDVGTSTIVAQLLDLNKVCVLKTATKQNPQASYGADIISRIAFAVKSEQNFSTLRYSLLHAIEQIIISLTAENKPLPKKILLVGNAVMQHFFCGFDIKPLSFYPFRSEHREIAAFCPADLGWKGIGFNTEILFMPSIGGFVGSDILAGLVATGIAKSAKPSVLIDLGTNGEIAVGNREKIFCASTAAGPAFEGINISCGMSAQKGAISSLSGNGHNLRYSVIGGGFANGVCGSGIVDAMAYLVRSEIIDNTGAFTKGKKQWNISDTVFINQKDVRGFQLAKAALAAGVQLLLKVANLRTSETENVYICGAFGHFIQIDNLMKICSLGFKKTAYRKQGNTALNGAKKILFTNDFSQIERILRISEHLALEGESDFQDVFIENMLF